MTDDPRALQKPHRRDALTSLITLTGGLAAGGWTGAAQADNFPSMPVRIIVPYAPGGNTDNVARAYGPALSDDLGQPVVFDNRGGAAGTLGVGLGAKAAADGYNYVVGDIGSLVIAPHSIPSLPYKPLTDLAPVSLLASVSIVVCVLPDSPLKTFGDLMAAAKATPGKLTYGTSGVGSPSHLAMEELRARTGLDLLHVPFKGGAQAVTAVLGGHIDVMIDGAALGQVRGGKLRAIAVTGPRLPVLPDVPGIGETVPGFEFTNWWGVLAPAGTPPATVARMHQAIVKAAAMPALKDKLSSMGLTAKAGPPADFAAFLKEETAKVDKIVRDAGIKF